MGCDHKEKLKILQEARHRTCYSADEIMIPCSYSLTISDGNRSRYYGALDSSNVPLSLTYDEELSNEVCDSSKLKRPVCVFPQATLCTDFSACVPIVSSWQTTTGVLMPITDKECSDNNDRSWSVTIMLDSENSYLVPFPIQSEEIHECTTEYQFVQPQYESQIHHSNTACDDFGMQHTSSWGCANKSLVKSDIPKDSSFLQREIQLNRKVTIFGIDSPLFYGKFVVQVEGTLLWVPYLVSCLHNLVVVVCM